MFKVLSVIAMLVSFSLAEEICNTDNLPTIPANSCVQEGYVCGLGFDVSHESNVMFFLFSGRCVLFHAFDQPPEDFFVCGKRCLWRRGKVLFD